MAEEKIYFEEGDVKVTNARFLTYGKMHSMANVTSVAKYVVKPKRTGPIVLGIIGLICFAFKWWLAVLLLAGAVAWWMTQKNNYVVSLASSSGNQEALSSTDEAFIDRVVNALNDAIAERG
ncbi:MAG TPA: DUF6232 family protein [Paludibacteraceae bacterium]|jgi:hypothetical protein|nr:MAG: hypothetical protein BWZ11_00645 [Bacteroidetes bacterium ADurb.BinA395]HOR39662.1 DUF6232 family protein [Paludibacteraceae bacterium]HPL76258.1 DUF6232 family protein [Paludibacteraceae bacterium]HQF11702.1 DUF6232 family protein [Paludibacteraceae bacterium]